MENLNRRIDGGVTAIHNALQNYFEDLAYFLRQRVGRKWFWDKGEAGRGDFLLGDRVVRVSRHEKNLHVRMCRRKRKHQFASAHLRHDQVGDHHVDRLFVIARHLKSLLTVPGLQHHVAILAQNF